MKWIPLQSEEQLELIKSSGESAIVFKHSTRCSISRIVKRNFEMDWDESLGEMPVYYLDLLNFRTISNKIAEEFNVIHESPQLLLIRDGECRYNASHSAVSLRNLKPFIDN